MGLGSRGAITRLHESVLQGSLWHNQWICIQDPSQTWVESYSHLNKIGKFSLNFKTYVIDDSKTFYFMKVLNAQFHPWKKQATDKLVIRGRKYSCSLWSCQMSVKLPMFYLTAKLNVQHWTQIKTTKRAFTPFHDVQMISFTCTCICSLYLIWFDYDSG